MNIVCERSVLAAALGLVQRAVALKSPLPNLKGILFKAENQQLVLSATDLEFGITCQLETNVAEAGAIVLPAKLLTDFVRRLPDQLVEIKTDPENQLKVLLSCDQIKLELSGFAPEEFPRLPAVKGEAAKITVKETLLREMLVQTEIALARDDTRPVLTGLLMEVGAGKIKFVATDGHRLAFRQAVGGAGTELKAIIPGRAVQELVRILEPDAERQVNISVDGSSIVFELDGIALSTRLLEGKYPPYQQIIPTNFKTTAEFNAASFGAALERAEILVRDGGNNLVKLAIKDSGIELLAFCQDVGTVSDFISAGINGEGLEIRFNVRLLLDCLKNLQDRDINMDFTGEFSPSLIRPVGEHDYLYLVLPVRVN